MAVTIAVRYSGARKQFGPNDSEEIPVLEYQLQVGYYVVLLFTVDSVC